VIINRRQWRVGATIGEFILRGWNNQSEKTRFFVNDPTTHLKNPLGILDWTPAVTHVKTSDRQPSGQWQKS
jgi:hypothetical protein